MPATIPEPTYAQLKASRDRWRHLARVYQYGEWCHTPEELLDFEAQLNDAYDRLTHGDITDDFREDDR